jgi:hypothetical protein
VVGAVRHQRSEERTNYRNGHRPRSLTTQVGDLELLIPKLRSWSFLPSILEPRRRVDQALYAVIMEAYIGGVYTSKVDALVEDALIEVPTMRRFAGIELISERIPDETTILAFRHLLEKHDLGKQIFETVKCAATIR